MNFVMALSTQQQKQQSMEESKGQQPVNAESEALDRVLNQTVSSNKRLHPILDDCSGFILEEHRTPNRVRDSCSFRLNDIPEDK